MLCLHSFDERCCDDYCREQRFLHIKCFNMDKYLIDFVYHYLKSTHNKIKNKIIICICLIMMIGVLLKSKK